MITRQFARIINVNNGAIEVVNQSQKFKEIMTNQQENEAGEIVDTDFDD